MEKNNDLMSGKGEKGKWITVNGSHIFIEDGQSVKEAVNKKFDKGKGDDNDFVEYSTDGKPRGQKDFDDYQIGYSKNSDGTYTALTGSSSKSGFKTEKGAQQWLEKKGMIKVTGISDFDALQKSKTGIDQNKTRADKYTDGNSDNITKSSTIRNIANDLKEYKGLGKADLVLPGGKWAQIRPQKDGTYLVRSNYGSKYVESVEAAKNELIKSFVPSISPEKARAFAKGDGHLSDDGGYQGVGNIKTAPTFEYKPTVSNEARNKKIDELMSYGYTKEQSEQAFDASVDFWQKQLKCDRETAIKIVAKDNG